MILLNNQSKTEFQLKEQAAALFKDNFIKLSEEAAEIAFKRVERFFDNF